MRILTTALVMFAAFSIVGSNLLHLHAPGDPASGAEPSARPLWFAGVHPTQQAIAITTELRHAEERGLRPADYGIDELVRAVPELGGPIGTSSPQPTPANIPQLDGALTLVVRRFVSDLHSGRVSPREVGSDLDVVRPKFAVDAVLNTLAHAPLVSATLDGLEPQFLHYRLLKAVLARYRQLALYPELNDLPDPGSHAIRPGALYPGAPALRRLLVALGDLSTAPVSSAQARASALPPDSDLQLDPDLVRALQTFQARHGLAQDGALGRGTWRALTTPFSQRVTQIELSMERWRWLPPRLDSPAIIVNIPEFRLFALYTTADLEQQMLRMDVIVGKSFPILRTPVFAADMRYLVLHPYWDVPYSIVKRELLPSIRRDPGYIERNDYEIVRGATDAAAVQPVTPQTIEELASGSLRLRLRQKPGPKNPLGFVKFMLPNRHNVYLHGTSAPALFAGAQRAFSHGCVRVADPMALMSYVLRDNPEWDAERILAQLQQPGPYRINLRTPIRVFVVYTTALAAEDGRALFFSDIYREDAKLEALLDARSGHLTHPELLVRPGS